MQIHRYAGEPATPTGGPSAALWAECPWSRFVLDPSKGYTYWDDFTGPHNKTDGDGYIVSQDANGQIVTTNLAGGAILIDSNGNAASHDGVNVQVSGTTWLPAVGKDLWFEARIKMTDCATSPDEHFIGLHDINTDIIEQSGGALDESSADMIGFYQDASTSTTEMEFVTCKVSSPEIDTNIATVANGTWIKLGFWVRTVNGVLTVEPYVNGDVQLADIVTDTDDIPVSLMTLSYVAQVGQTSADAEIYVDWVRIAQAR